MRVIDILENSEASIQKALSTSKYKTELNSLPKISEIFNFFRGQLIKNETLETSSLPHPPTNLKELTEGIYFKNNFLICATSVSAEEFKYKALYTGSIANQSCIQQELSGMYLTILKVASDNIHLEPLAFSYLLRDDFFQSESTRFIVPFLVLPSTIPEALEFQWPYLAMRELSRKLSPLIEYSFLITNDEELELLGLWGLLPDESLKK